MTIGYKEELEGDWAVFAKIAGFFVNKVPPDDREDFLHDSLVEMVKVKAKYEAKGKALTEAGLMRVADYEFKRYWDLRRYRLFGLHCNSCTSEQRRECHTMRLPSECPKGKAYPLSSLNKILKDGDGGKPIELSERIPDNKPIDIDAKLDARDILQGLPKRLVQIGYKIYSGIPLETKEKEYLKHWQKAHHTPFVRRQDHLSDLSSHLSHLRVYVRELNRYLAQLIKEEEKMVKTERDERIRQAHFIKGWSIKRINRELHHGKETIRKAIRAAGIV